MLLRPWIQLYRSRLIYSAGVALFLAIVAHMWVSANGLTDFGIFWHSFCGCPVDPDDAYVLLNLPPLTALVIGLILGYPQTNGVADGGIPGSSIKAYHRFLLTRPLSRTQMFSAPIGLAIAAISVLPLLAILLLLGWLKLVHAPSLMHLLATIRVIPAVHALGPNASLLSLLTALQAPRRYLAAISVGVCAYALLAVQPWLAMSPNRKLNLLGVLPLFVLFAPMLSFLGRSVVSALFLAPGHGMPLTYVPSVFGIGLHFGLAAAVIYGCWTILGRLEL